MKFQSFFPRVKEGPLSAPRILLYEQYLAETGNRTRIAATTVRCTFKVCNTFFTSSLSTACSNAQICSFVITNKIPFQKLVHLYCFRVFILLKLLSVAHGQHYITLSIIAYYYKVGAGFLLVFTNTSSSTLLYSQKKTLIFVLSLSRRRYYFSL